MPSTKLSKKLLNKKFTTKSAMAYMTIVAVILQCIQMLNAQGSVGSKDLFRCRQSCYQKFVQDWHHCMDFEDCKNMCITPPNINSYIPEAFSFLCWNNCDQQLGPFPLNINSALRQGSLVLTDIGWDQAITNASKQCLVTWEVSGGGLMGNLLTDSSTVELSLWPDTVYHVQVTCKHKETGGMRRSYKLIVDTHKLSDSMATGVQAIALDSISVDRTMPNIYGNEAISATSSETDSRMRILKDSSKDFLTPYNPNAVGSSSTSASRISSSTTSSSSSSSSSGSSSPSDKTTTSKTSISTSSAYSTPHGNTVLRTKLTSGFGSTNSESTLPFLTESIVFAMVGSVVLFFGLLALYVLTRPTPKELSAALVGAIDKEVLIHNEMLPSQTPAAVAKSTSTSSAALQQVSEARTLHV